MSFTVPAITSVEVTAAVPNYVKKFHIHSYAKITGIGTGTYYEICDLEEVEVLFIIFNQDNTDNAAKNCDVRLTVDGEVFTILNEGLSDNVNMYTYLVPPSTLGTKGELGLSTNAFLTGLQYSNATPTNIPSTLKGHSVKFEISFDAIGANQELHGDVYYYKKEAP